MWSTATHEGPVYPHTIEMGVKDAAQILLTARRDSAALLTASKGSSSVALNSNAAVSPEVVVLEEKHSATLEQSPSTGPPTPPASASAPASSSSASSVLSVVESDSQPVPYRAIFRSQDDFESYAVELLQSTHPEVVIEKKRSAKTTTISCRNRRSVRQTVSSRLTEAEICCSPLREQEGAGGANCTCVLKASLTPDEGPDKSKWGIILRETEHVALCLARMDARLAEREGLEEDVQAIVRQLKQPTPAIPERRKEPPTDAVVAPPVKTRKGSGARYIEADSDDETPGELRRRKANHPGNVLPSRARRYKW